MANHRNQRLLGFLLISLFLHTACLMLPSRHQLSQESARRAAPLAVRLSPVRPPGPLDPAAQAPRATPRHTAVPPTKTRLLPLSAERLVEHPGARQATPPADIPRASVDLQQALATARRIAREWQPTPNPLGAPALPLTVETAIARATAPDSVVETRGAAGERVIKSRHSRCVTPVWVPHFLEGKSMLTQCEAWQG